MKILVIGDTHGKLDKVRDIYPKLTDIDIIAHTGDHMRDGTALEKNWACLFCVKGNCDGGSDRDFKNNRDGIRQHPSHPWSYAKRKISSQLAYV